MLRPLLTAAILTGYAATLAVSSWHLAEWYALTRGTLPGQLSFALAITLEANAFILSLLSNSLLRRSVWAQGGSLVALSLVWLGNYLSMRRAAPELSAAEVLAASAFVPIGTFIMAKVLGELLGQGEPKAPPASSPVPSPALGTPLAGPAEAEGPTTPEEEDVLSALAASPMRLRELALAVPHLREQLPDLLRSLEAKGRIRLENGFWTLAEEPAAQRR